MLEDFYIIGRERVLRRVIPVCLLDIFDEILRYSLSLPHFNNFSCIIFTMRKASETVMLIFVDNFRPFLGMW